MTETLEKWYNNRCKGTIKCSNTDLVTIQAITIWKEAGVSFTLVSKSADFLNRASVACKNILTIHFGGTFIVNIPKTDLIVVHNIDEFTFNQLLNIPYKRILGITSKFIADKEVFKMAPVFTTVETKVDGKLFYYGIDLPTKDRELYDFQSKYITDTMSMFGNDMQNLHLCHKGDRYSSAESHIVDYAASRGWKKGIDLSNDYNKQVDELYNPIKIAERVSNFFDVVRSRNKILEENEEKIKTILDLFPEGIRAITLCDSPTMADRLTESYNAKQMFGMALSYHNNLPNTSLTNPETSTPVLDKKGNIKQFGVTAQKKNALTAFYENRLSCLNISHKIDDYFEVEGLDLLVTTSLEIEFFSILGSKIHFKGNPRIVVVYFKDTKEQDRMNKLQQNTGMLTDYVFDKESLLLK